MDSIKFTFQESLNIQKCDPFLLNNRLPWLAKADALLKEQWLNPIHSTPIQSNSIQFTYDALVAKVSAQACLPPSVPYSIVYLVAQVTTGSKGMQSLPKQLGLCTKSWPLAPWGGWPTFWGTSLPTTPSPFGKCWMLLLCRPVFLNGNLRVINI